MEASGAERRQLGGISQLTMRSVVELSKLAAACRPSGPRLLSCTGCLGWIRSTTTVFSRLGLVIVSPRDSVLRYLGMYVGPFSLGCGCSQGFYIALFFSDIFLTESSLSRRSAHPG